MNDNIIKQKATKYYAVRRGRNPGVYTDVNEYRAQVDGFEGYLARVFKNEQEAKDYVSGKITDTEIREAKSRDLRGIACPLSKEHQNDWDLKWRAAQTVAAYVDGSHNDETNKCGYGVVITTGDGREILLYGLSKEASKTGLRSHAAEISGCMAAMEWAKQKRVKKLILICDSSSVIELAMNGGRPENEFMRKFVNFYKDIIRDGKIEIEFKKITGHVGNQYGDLSDALARYALGKTIKYTYKQIINKNIPTNWETVRPREKKEKKKQPVRKEIYDKWTPRSSIYRVDMIRNAVVLGHILAVQKDGYKITHLTASFKGEFLNIKREDFGETVFMYRENAERKRYELNG